MSAFTSNEIAYLESQRLGRLATVNPAGEPHVVPVTFRYNADVDTIDIGGLHNSKTKKYRDAARTGRVAFIVDDVLPPWQPRGLEIRGRAEVLPDGGQQINPAFEPGMIRIRPARIVSWGIESDTRRSSGRSVG